MKIKPLAALFIISFNAKADVLSPVLRKYTNDILVCTGIASGDIFAHAIVVNCELGAFSEIYGVEADRVLADHSREYVIPQHIGYWKANKLKTCLVYHKNPLLELESVINKINRPITFVLASQFPDWVDPHKNNLILQELDQIKRNCLKEHTILIDYIYFRNVNLNDVKNKLLEINSNYKFRFEDGGHLGREKNAVLAAYFN